MRNLLHALLLSGAALGAASSAPLCAQDALPSPQPKSAAPQAKRGAPRAKPAQQAKPAAPQAKPAAPKPGPEVQGDENTTPAQLQQLRENYRPSIHPGDPLHIVGLEQDGNDLRASTPALAQGELEPQQVDLDAAYQRALAMYGDDASFHAPLPPPGSTEPEAPEAAPEPAPVPLAQNAPEAVSAPAEPRRWPVFAGFAVSALLIAWFFLRVRPALTAPAETAEPEREPFVWNPTRRAKNAVQAPYAEPPAPLPRRAATPDEARTRAR